MAVPLDLPGGAAVSGLVVGAVGWMVFWAVLGVVAAVAVWLAGTLTSRRRRP